MRSRRVILATASALLVLALVAGAVAFHRLQRLRERQDDTLAYVRLARSLSERLEDESWPPPDSGDATRFLDRVVEQLDALGPRDPLRGSLERTRALLREGGGELRPAARELQRSALEEIVRTLERSGERTAAVGQNLLQISLIGGPLLAALAAGVLLATIHLPLRRAGRARSVGAAAEAVSGVSSELAELLRDLDSERRARIMDLVRTGHLAALGTFAAGIAHEVRNPLMAVAGVAESARRRVEVGDSTLDLPAELRRIDSEVHRAGELLGQVLRLAPGEPQKPQRFDLVAEIAEVASMVAARFRLETGWIDLETPGSVVIRGQSARYRQILYNLLTNAVDSVLDAGKSLATHPVKLSLLDENGALELSVEDRGTGFDQARARRLFEPFYTSKGRDGSGLGLFICEGLAREIGGKVEAYSAGPGEGATFRVKLPRADMDHEHEPRTDHRG